LSNKTIALYIHIPWCVKKCPYCDFNSHTTDAIPFDQYFKALTADLKQYEELLTTRQLSSIFIGGGTPSLIPAQYYRQLFDSIEAMGLAIKQCEITIEMNPGTIDNHHLKDYRTIGINRLSVGVQSFDDLALQQIGRIHSSGDAIKTMELAQQYGFDNCNIDLMYGLPSQTMQQCLADIDTACNLPITHLSWYHLTIEPNTIFYSLPPQLPTDDLQDQMYLEGCEWIAAKGFNRYEISAYSKPTKQCTHNLNYWQYGDYLGIGAGAHSKLTTQGCVQRFAKSRQPKRYMANIKAVSTHFVKAEELILDMMLNCMRLTAGFALDRLSRYSGVPLAKLKNQLQPLVANGFLTVIDDNNYCPTAKGIDFQNEALQLL